MAADRVSQIRELWIELASEDDDSSDDEVSNTKRARHASRGISSSSTSSRSKAAGSRQLSSPSPKQRTEERIDTILRFIRGVHGGSFPFFNDDNPDPGCQYEVLCYSRVLDPVFVPEADRNLNLRSAAQYNPELPRIRALLEKARETHWQLTAGKGFAALKERPIPELQQLLAYTAADVMQYAAIESGVFPGDLDDFETEAEKLWSSKNLWGPSSLIGQLCPALRLCLAAEVATGLLCDSQPAPPDTPEHASALLLFLAAALKQAEQECELADAQVSWNESSLDYFEDMEALMDFFMCLAPDAAASVLLHSSDSSSRSGSSRSGSSSRSSAGRQQQQQEQQEQQQHSCCYQASYPRDWVQGNVVMAALQVAAVALEEGNAESSSSSCSSKPDNTSSSAAAAAAAAAADGAEHPQAQDADAELSTSDTPVVSDGSGATLPPAAGRKLWRVLQKLKAATKHQQQQQPTTAQHGDQQVSELQEGAQQQQQQQQPASQVAAISDVVSFTMGLVEGFFEQHLVSSRQQAASTEPSEATQPEASAAADQEAGTASAVSHDSASDIAAGNATSPGEAAADDVAWHVAVLTGAVVLARFFAASRGTFCPVRTALLCTAVEGLYFSVRETLLNALLGSRLPSCQCSMCRLQQQLLQDQQQQPLQQLEQQQPEQQLEQQQPEQQQQQQQEASNDVTSEGVSARQCSADVTSKMLQLLHLTNTLCECSTDQAAATPSSTSSTSRAQQQQQQQPQQDEDAAVHNALARAQVVTSDSEVLQVCPALVKTQGSAQFRNSPSCWLTNAFARLGLSQLSPVCLQQQQQQQSGSAAAASILGQQQQSSSAPAGNNPDVAADAESGRPKASEVWMAVFTQEFLRSLVMEHYQPQQQQQPQQRSASSSTSGSSSTGPSAPAAPLPDHAAGWLRDNRFKNCFYQVVGPMLAWQGSWAGLAEKLRFTAGRFDDFEAIRRNKQLKSAERSRRKEQKEQKAKKEQSQLEQKQGAADAGKQQLQRKLFGGGGASSSSSSGGGDSDDNAEGKGGKAEKALDVSSDEDSQQVDVGRCLLCAAEQAAGGPVQFSRRTDSSSGSSSGLSGLYGQFPVSWSDPFMMRRLLWDLLGRIKPTAQAWFKKHTRMCPHRASVTLWQMVVMSLARHLWAPPGPWGSEAQEQMALVLPPSVANANKLARNDPVAAAVRQTYACSLNIAASHKGALNSSAAVVSMHVLLALDPHGARVQPRPELLYYTPSGFHAAVCKTLMQALQLPLPPRGSALGAVSASTAAGSQDQDQQQQQQGCQTGPELGQQQSYLQAWSGAAFPAYYVWWHIGLVAYHQQQQLQAHAQQLQQQLQQQMLSLRQQVRKGMGSAAAEGLKHKDRQQQQQQDEEQQQQQGHRKQQQLGRRGGRTVSDTEELPEAQQLVEPAAAAKLSGIAAAAAASTTQPQDGMQPRAVLLQSAASSSSSSAGSGGLPANMAELYSDPNARLFAVGYALRQINSGAQLLRMLSNPPVPLGLCQSAKDWIGDFKRQTCRHCNQDLAAAEKSGAVVWFCQECGSHYCSPECMDSTACGTAACEPHMATRVAVHRRWRLLNLLQPPCDLQQLPAAAAAASAAAACSIPPAGNGALPDIMAVWLGEVEAAELASGGRPPLFQPYSKPAQQAAAGTGAAGAAEGADRSGSVLVATRDQGDAAELRRVLHSMGLSNVKVYGRSLTATRPERSFSDDDKPSHGVSSDPSASAGSSNSAVATTTSTTNSSSSAPGRSGPPGFDEQQVHPGHEVAAQLAQLQMLRPLELHPPPGMSDVEWQDRMHVPIMSRRYGPAPHAAAAGAEHPDTDDSSSSSTEHYSNDFEAYTDGEAAPAGCALAPAGPERGAAGGVRGRTAAAAAVAGIDAASRLPRLKQDAADKVALLERDQRMGMHTSSSSRSSTEVEPAAAVPHSAGWQEDLD